MSGGSGPTVTLQMPSSPLVIGWGLPSSSPEAVTCCAFGANSLTVMFPSALTSGETVRRPAPPAAPAAPSAGGRRARGRLAERDRRDHHG